MREIPTIRSGICNTTPWHLGKRLKGLSKDQADRIRYTTHDANPKYRWCIGDKTFTEAEVEHIMAVSSHAWGRKSMGKVETRHQGYKSKNGDCPWLDYPQDSAYTDRSTCYNGEHKWRVKYVSPNFLGNFLQRATLYKFAQEDRTKFALRIGQVDHPVAYQKPNFITESPHGGRHF